MKFYGFNQDGLPVYIGEFDDITDADMTPEGRYCIWLWNEESLREFVDNANEALKLANC